MNDKVMICNKMWDMLRDEYIIERKRMNNITTKAINMICISVLFLFTFLYIIPFDVLSDVFASTDSVIYPDKSGAFNALVCFSSDIVLVSIFLLILGCFFLAKAGGVGNSWRPNFKDISDIEKYSDLSYIEFSEIFLNHYLEVIEGNVEENNKRSSFLYAGTMLMKISFPLLMVPSIVLAIIS